jgi:hypothetical protein
MHPENASTQTMDEVTAPQEALAESDGPDSCEPWGGLLASAGPRDHIVQLYQDQQFLNRAVCRFAASAIANGEGVILVPTAEHWQAFRPRLEAEGVDIKAAQACGQLTVVDADELLPRFMHDAMPDAPVFLGLAADVVAKARDAGRYPKVRWWGEMVNILWERGDVAASMQLEDQFDRLADEYQIAISACCRGSEKTTPISFPWRITRGSNVRWPAPFARRWVQTRPVCWKSNYWRAPRRHS